VVKVNLYEVAVRRLLITEDYSTLISSHQINYCVRMLEVSRAFGHGFN